MTLVKTSNAKLHDTKIAPSVHETYFAFFPGEEKMNEDLLQLLFSVKILRNFTSLPGFPLPLRRIVMTFKDFVDLKLDAKGMEQLMRAPNVTEAFKLLEHPETSEHFDGKFYKEL